MAEATEIVVSGPRFTPEGLMQFSDEQLDQVGAEVARSLRQKRNELLCERNGHNYAVDSYFCVRCGGGLYQ